MHWTIVLLLLFVSAETIASESGDLTDWFPCSNSHFEQSLLGLLTCFWEGMIGFVTGLISGSHEHEPCLELDWEPFETFLNHMELPGCWDDNTPSYHLYLPENKSCLVANQPDHLQNIVACPHMADRNLSKLVILIHGFNNNAEGTWGSIVQYILSSDSSSGIVGVLTVDWSNGAYSGPGNIYYSHPAANTRYIGVATERVVKQLGQSMYIHCIGQSLGAHTCSFVANALKKDIGIDMNRLTGLDPAGYRFLVDAGLHPYDVAPVDERLDKTDALLVDVIHTDGGLLGTMKPLGHVDFYIGSSESGLGSHQAWCSGIIDNLCAHSGARDLLRSSLMDPTGCWATYQCDGPGEERSPDENTLIGCRNVSEPQFGYFYNGNIKGIFGVQLPSSTCNVFGG